MSIKRAKSISEFYTTKFKTVKLNGALSKALGEPSPKGSWMIFGGSGHGKTALALQICKALCEHMRGAYDSLEQGASLSFKRACIQQKMEQVKSKFIILDKEPIAELKERLRKHKSPQFIVIDSVQYTGMKYDDYKKLLDEFPEKLFILISHADGKNPQGRVAKSIRFDADVKIRVEGYKAFTVSRFGGEEDYVIWEKGANDYWGIPN